MKKRFLLKLSGEQFAGTEAFGIDMRFLKALAIELRTLIRTSKAQIAIIVGGGNILRGAELAGKERMVERATADYMGMLATVINGMALVDVLEKTGQPARLQSRIRINNVAEPFIRRRAIRHLEKGRIVIVGGGTGNPFVTTDTAAVSTALELDCDIVLKATKVNGVYTKDPKKHRDAKKLPRVSYLDALNNKHIKVMDGAAISLAMEHNLPIRVFDLLIKGNMRRAIRGENVGTLVSN